MGPCRETAKVRNVIAMAMMEVSQTREIDGLIEALAEVRAECLAVEESLAEEIEAIPGNYQRSARNLAHYLALRQHDARDLQRRLHRLGLSSLGRLEAHTLAGLDAVLRALYGLRAGRRKAFAATRGAVSFEEGPELLSRHAEALLGPARGPAARIMVTMPHEAANRYDLVRDLVAAGMNVMRVNCAHDDVGEWTRMAQHLRRAVREVGRPCRLLVDLGGPKLRTGAIESGARVVRWKPKRDVRGRPIVPAHVLIYSAVDGERPASRFDAMLPAAVEFVRVARKGDVVRVEDARGRTRELIVRGTGRGYLWAEADHSCYAEQGAGLSCGEMGRRSRRRRWAKFRWWSSH